MPKFTSIENLKIQALQSLIEAPTNSELVELGTKTLDDRGFWEDNNFNETTLEPYLTENNLTLRTINVDGITFLPSISNSSIFQYSIDALPFVTDPNDRNEIIRLDNYYDKEQESNKYYLATEGKINYYIYPRTSGRPTPNGHIDNYQGRQYISRFDTYADAGVENGFYLFKLNWGDGTKIEYTDEPKLLESTVLLNHNYKKPGFYTISGVVYVADLNGNIGGYERFETKILLNPSQNYELSLYDYDNFATIGGISEDSVMIKSAANLIGINPNTLNTDKSSPDIIEDVNLLDKFQLLNLLNKVSGSILDNFDELLNIEFNKYEERLAEVPEPVEVEEDEPDDTISYRIKTHNFYINYNVSDDGSVTLNWTTITPDKFKFNQFDEDNNWVVDLNNIDYVMYAARYLGPATGYETPYQYIGVVGNNINEFVFDNTNDYFQENTTYQFRLRGRIKSPDNLDIFSNYGSPNPSSINTEVTTTDEENTSSGNTGGNTGGGNTGGNTSDGNTGGGNTGGGNTGGGKAPGDDDVELPGDNEVDQYGGGVS